MMTLGSSSNTSPGILASSDSRRPCSRVRPYGADRQHSYSRLKADGATMPAFGGRWASQCPLLAQSGHPNAHCGIEFRKN